MKFPKRMFFYFFAIHSKMALRIFAIFCMSVEDFKVHFLSKISFLKKFLIPDYSGWSFQKGFFFYFFAIYSKMALRIYPYFCMTLEDNKAHCLSKIVFLKKLLIPDYRGLIFQRNNLNQTMGPIVLFIHAKNRENP